MNISLSQVTLATDALTQETDEKSEIIMQRCLKEVSELQTKQQLQAIVSVNAKLGFIERRVDELMGYQVTAAGTQRVFNTINDFDALQAEVTTSLHKQQWGFRWKSRQDGASIRRGIHVTAT